MAKEQQQAPKDQTGGKQGGKKGGEPQPPGPAVRELHKRVRNAKKKLGRVTELEDLRASGHTLTPEQVPVLGTKPCLVAVLEELGKFEPLLQQAVKEEVQQDVQADREKTETRLRAKLQQEQQQREQEWAREREGLVQAREAAEAATEREREASKQREQAAPSKARMQELLREPLHKLLQLLYFSEVGGVLLMLCAVRSVCLLLWVCVCVRRTLAT